MVKSLTSLIFFVFFCSVLAATINGNGPVSRGTTLAENNLASAYYLALQNNHF